jgi:hypothetical protein
MSKEKEGGKKLDKSAPTRTPKEKKAWKAQKKTDKKQQD